MKNTLTYVRYAGIASALLAFPITQASAATIWSEDFESIPTMIKDGNNVAYFNAEYSTGQWVAPSIADTNGARVAALGGDSEYEVQIKGYPFTPNRGKAQCITISLDESLFTATGAGTYQLSFDLENISNVANKPSFLTVGAYAAKAGAGDGATNEESYQVNMINFTNWLLPCVASSNGSASVVERGFGTFGFSDIGTQSINFVYDGSGDVLLVVSLTNTFDVQGFVNVDNFLLEDVPGNSAPYFDGAPLTALNAAAESPYSDSIAGTAQDVDVTDTIVYSYVSGPAWLNVAANGDLSGTPTTDDLGLNTFTVRADDQNGGVTDVTLEITVDPPAAIWQEDFSVATLNVDGDAHVNAEFTTGQWVGPSTGGSEGAATIAGGELRLRVVETGEFRGYTRGAGIALDESLFTSGAGTYKLFLQVLNYSKSTAYLGVSLYDAQTGTNDGALIEDSYIIDTDNSFTVRNDFLRARVGTNETAAVSFRAEEQFNETDDGLGLQEVTFVYDGTGDMVLLLGAMTDVDSNGSILLDNLSVVFEGGNSAPYFGTKRIARSNATAGAAYSDTVNGAATDLNISDTLTYSKVGDSSTTGWLVVATDGTLSGTPDLSDLTIDGVNRFVIQVDDGNGGTATVDLEIIVDDPSRIFSEDFNSLVLSNIDYDATFINSELTTNQWVYGGFDGAEIDAGRLKLRTTNIGLSRGAGIALDESLFTFGAGNYQLEFQISSYSANGTLGVVVYEAQTGAGDGATQAESYALETINYTVVNEDLQARTGIGGTATVDFRGRRQFNSTDDGTGVFDMTFYYDGTGDVILLFGAMTTQVSTQSVTIDNVSVTYNAGNAIPYFTVVQPLVGSSANAGVAYTGSVAGAFDAESDALTYSKVTGPAWLQVAANGDLSGTPTTDDFGKVSYFSVGVSDAGGSGLTTQARLKVRVFEQGDLDFDLLDDTWETTFFGSAAVVDGTGNSDGDSFTDLEEYVAGSSPIDGSSFFSTEINSVIAGSSVDVAFEGVAGRTYTLQTRESLSSGSWIAGEAVGPLATDGPQLITHPITTETKIFIRVRAEYP